MAGGDGASDEKDGGRGEASDQDPEAGLIMQDQVPQQGAGLHCGGGGMH